MTQFYCKLLHLEDLLGASNQRGKEEEQGYSIGTKIRPNQEKMW